MNNLIKDLLAYEGDLLLDYKAEGHFAIRPSSILLVLFAMFYCLSGVDLVPELLVRPKAVGYIDDLLLSIAVIAYTYKDWSVLNGFGTVRSRDVSRDDDDRESEVRVRDRHENGDASGGDTLSGRNPALNHDTLEVLINTADSRTDGTVDSYHDDVDNGQDEPVVRTIEPETAPIDADDEEARRARRAARRAQRTQRDSNTRAESISEGDI